MFMNLICFIKIIHVENQLIEMCLNFNLWLFFLAVIRRPFFVGLFFKKMVPNFTLAV